MKGRKNKKDEGNDHKNKTTDPRVAMGKTGKQKQEKPRKRIGAVFDNADYSPTKTFCTGKKGKDKNKNRNGGDSDSREKVEKAFFIHFWQCFV